MEAILLDIKDSSLILKFGKDRELASASRTYFEFLLNFYYSESQNIFISQKEGNIKHLFVESIRFLDSRKIKYQLSSQVELIRSEINQFKDEFKRETETALKIKKHNIQAKKIENFSRSLKDYQYKSFRHLLAIKNGANFSVPGSGKTTIAYAYFNHLIKEKIIDKLLVIGPRSSFLPWEEEYVYCFNKQPKIKRISGDKNLRSKIYASVDQYDIFLTTYQTASNDIDDLVRLCRHYKCFVILDESHYIKRFAGRWSSKILKLATVAHIRLILTGTPAPNSFKDLWNQVYFLWPEQNVLGGQQEFYRLLQTAEGILEIKKRLAPLFCRISKKDLKLPRPKYRKIFVDLAPQQKRIYEALAVKFLTELKEPKDVISKLREWRKARIVRLIEASSNPTLLSKYAEEFRVPPIDSSNLTLTDLIYQYSQHEVPSKMLVLLNEVRRIIKKEDKVVVWTNFVLNIKMLSKMLKKEGIKFARVYGEIPKDFSDDEEDNREKEIARFKQDKTIKVLLANPAACSESISLHTVCKTAIYLDRTFNCGQYLQSLDRIHRLGLNQEDKITYIFLLSRNTIDEVIHKRLIEKSNMMESLLSDDINIGSFDTDAADVIGDETEEERDYKEVMTDLIKKYKKYDIPHNISVKGCK